MSHKVLKAIGDEPAKAISMQYIDHPTSVTNEFLSVLSTLNKPPTGFDKLELSFKILDQKVSQTILDQFTNHCRQLKELDISTYGLESREEDELNLCDLAVRILEAQTMDNMESLTIRDFGWREKDDKELPEERQQLINGIVRSG